MMEVIAALDRNTMTVSDAARLGSFQVRKTWPDRKVPVRSVTCCPGAGRGRERTETIRATHRKRAARYCTPSLSRPGKPFRLMVFLPFPMRQSLGYILNQSEKLCIAFDADISCGALKPMVWMPSERFSRRKRLV